MVVSCEQVWREVSNYVDGEVAPVLQTAMEEHFRGCQKCRSVLAGTRNVVGLFGEESMFEPPVGFSQRLRRKLEANMPRRKGTAFGWMVATAAALLLAGAFELGRSYSFFTPELRSFHAQRGSKIPPDLMVVVADGGKTFHVPGCRFIHDGAKLRTIPASVALKEGYTPCVRCLKKYLSLKSDEDESRGELASVER